MIVRHEASVAMGSRSEIRVALAAPRRATGCSLAWRCWSWNSSACASSMQLASGCGPMLDLGRPEQVSTGRSQVKSHTLLESLAVIGMLRVQNDCVNLRTTLKSLSLRSHARPAVHAEHPNLALSMQELLSAAGPLKPCYRALVRSRNPAHDML